MKALMVLALAATTLIPAPSDARISEEPRCSGTAPTDFSCSLDLLIEQDHPAIFVIGPPVGALSAAMVTGDLEHRRSTLCLGGGAASLCDHSKSGSIQAGDRLHIRVEAAGVGHWRINVIYDLANRFPCREHFYGCEI